MIPIPKTQIPSQHPSFLTPQFLAQLKKQLSQKVKPSKSVLQALKHSNQANQQYKREIQELKSQIDLLTKQQIKDVEHPSTPSTAATKKIKFQRIQSFSHSSTINLTIKPQLHHQSPAIIELELLRQKVTHLQELLETKQKRCQQMVDRQAILAGQIDLLRLQNQNLIQRIKSLEEQYQKLAQRKHKEINISLNRNLPELININSADKNNGETQRSCFQVAKENDSGRSHESSKNKESRFKEADAKHNQYRNSWFKEEVKVEFQGQGLTRYINQGRNKSVLGVNCLDVDTSMMASCTQMIEIKEEYDIQRKATLNQPINYGQEDQFNEIDAILQQQVSKTSTNSISEEQQPYQNINSSFINIRVYDQSQKPPIETILI